MRVLLTLFVLLFPFVLPAQKAEEGIRKLYQKYPQEKVIIQYSKNEYLAGEPVFFKAHVLNGYEPSVISTNLYVELYDKTKKLLDKKLIPLFRGSGEGSFTLPASLAEDVYYVRAYTQWMLNFADRLQYFEPLRVYNPASLHRLQPKPVQWALRAVPEGGKMIAGEPTKLSVRLIAGGSLPSSWSGQVLEKETGRAVGNIAVFNREIGQAEFTSQAGKVYKVVAKDSEGNSRELDLPLASEAGIALRIKLSDKLLYYAIRFKNAPSKGVGYKLVGTLHDQLIFRADIQRSTGEVVGSIKTDSFPAGVLRLTLFDEKETPVAERLCFLHQSALAAHQPEVKLDTVSFAAKGRNAWRVTVDTASWTSYTLQVSDAAEDMEDNFLGDLYLRSDFSTPLHEASWYLKDVSTVKETALDALLITENWERYRWSSLLKNEFPVINFPPDAYLGFSGTVSAGRKLKPLREINLILQAKDSSIQFLQITTDSSATFTLANMIFTDTVKVYFQPNKRKFLEQDLKIDFVQENRFHPLRTALPFTFWTTVPRKANDSLPAAVKRAASQRNQELVLAEKSKTMQEVVVRTRARSATEELDRELSSPLFSSHDAMIFDFVNEDQTSAIGYNNILDWLQGRVPGFQTQTNQYGDLIPVIRNQVAQIYLDELLVDPGTLSSLSVSDIALVKVMRSSMATMGGNGAVAIYTRRGDMGTKSGYSSLLTNIITGYASVAPFFVPDYSITTNQSVPDERLVLYRSGFVKPDAGKAEVPLFFYNNDSAKSFRLTVTGFTKTGQPVYLQRIIR